MALDLPRSVLIGLPESVQKVLPQVDNSELHSDDLFEVQSEVTPIAAKWESVGKALHLKPDRLDVIREQQTTPQQRLSATLHEFLKKNYDWEKYGAPSWRLIVIALAHTSGGDNVELALEVAKEHSTNATAAASATNGAIVTKSSVGDDSGTPHSILDQEPDMKHIGMIKYKSGTEIKRYWPIKDLQLYWEAIARELEVPEATIKNARQHLDGADSVSEVMNYWIGADDKATWNRLLEAMEIRQELNRAAKTLKTALLHMVN